jgi:hypothetical protein
MPSTNTCGNQGNRCNTCASGNQCIAGNCSTGTSGGGPASGGGPTAGGGPAAAGGTMSGGGPTGAPNPSDCAVGADLIYTVDQNNDFASFDPKLLPANAFTRVGTLNCPTAGQASPFSMSVDRNAVAWVVYDSGELFKVEINNGLKCTKTDFRAQMNVALFGMGFVSDAPMSSQETLFISGNPLNSSLTNSDFGTLSVGPDFKLSLKGRMMGSPELTGTGLATLWAFFPNLNPPVVTQLNKDNGTNVVTYPAAELAGNPRAWAFAFWGGDFFIFLKRDTDKSTTVWRMNGQTHAVTAAVPNSGKSIVGAGVSTCAPIQIN